MLNRVLRGAVRARARIAKVAVGLALAASVLALGAPAHADELTKVDEALNRWKTLDYRFKIVTKKEGAEDLVIKLRTRMRREGGDNQQMTELDSPADLKGTKVLILAPTQMYIYLPQYKKVRRIASHVTEQGFLGTALSQRDLSLTRYGNFYSAKKASEADGSVKLVLTAKSGEAPYPKLELKVEKARWLPTEIKYFNDKGVHIKTETRSDYKCKDKICTPGVQKYVDHQAKLTTTINLVEYVFDSKVDDKVFSKRYLQK
jgi:outer membrane lipoprotein-sorting protein